MERSYQSFHALREANVQIGRSGGVDREGPESRHFLNFTVRPTSGPYGTPIGEPMDITLALTSRQMAQIVRSFFVELIYKDGIFTQMFRRLMTKRWAVMTAWEYKTPVLDETAFREMHYHREVPSGQVVSA